MSKETVGGPVGVEASISLLVLLLGERLTSKELAAALPHRYPDLHQPGSTGRKNFEKDKTTLERLGYTVRSEDAARAGGTLARYWVDADASPANVRFTPAQTIALSRLVQYMWLGADAQEDLADAVDADADEHAAALRVHAPATLATVWRAQLEGRSVTFVQDGRRWNLIDVVLTFDDQWRVTGWSDEEDGFRTFPVSTLPTVGLGAAGHRAPPTAALTDVGTSPLDWPMDPPCVAELQVDDGHLPDAMRTLRSPQRTPTLAHGVLRVEVVNREAFLRAVLRLGPHAVLLGPADLRVALLARLERWSDGR